MKMQYLVNTLRLLMLFVLLALSNSLSAATCSRTMGPYELMSQAQRIAREFRNAGYQTSGVWGQGGIISSWSNRRYYFNVFFLC